MSRDMPTLAQIDAIERAQDDELDAIADILWDAVQDAMRDEMEVGT